MFLLTRRQAKTALAATAAAAAYLAASELGARKLRLTGLWVLSSVAMAGVASISGTSKARAAHLRIDALVPAVGDAVTAANNALPKAGGTISGDLHVQGYAYGAGGVLDVGDDQNWHSNSASAVYYLNPSDANVHIGGGLGLGGGDLAMNGADMNGAGASHTGTAYINGYQLTMNHGAPGYSLSGAPSSYSASWETNLMHFVSDLYDGVANSGIMQ